MTVIVDYLDSRNVRHYDKVDLTFLEASKLAHLDGHAFYIASHVILQNKLLDCCILSVVKAVTV